MKTTDKTKAYRSAVESLAQALHKGHVFAVFTGRKVHFYATRNDDPNGPLDCLAANLPVTSPWAGSNYDLDAKYTAGCILAWMTAEQKENYGDFSENWANLSIDSLN